MNNAEILTKLESLMKKIAFQFPENITGDVARLVYHEDNSIFNFYVDERDIEEMQAGCVSETFFSFTFRGIILRHYRHDNYEIVFNSEAINPLDITIEKAIQNWFDSVDIFIDKICMQRNI